MWYRRRRRKVNKARIVVSVLTLSAAGFAGTVGLESFTGAAIRPVPGDRPTYGFGSTTRADGTPVQMGDKIAPPAAVRLAVKHIAGDEAIMRSCFGELTLLHQFEWDAYVDTTYTVGAWKVCQSSIPRKVRAGQYEAACKTILDFKSVQGRDCSQPVNTSFCGGIWTRRKQMAHLCLTGERP